MTDEIGGRPTPAELEVDAASVVEREWGRRPSRVRRVSSDVGKPAGNGMPIAGFAVRDAVIDGFGARQHYFNTFGGTPVPQAPESASPMKGAPSRS